MKTRPERKDFAAPNFRRDVKLMVSGRISLAKRPGVEYEVSRNMKIKTHDDQEIGQVAAVVNSSPNNAVAGLLLGRLPEKLGYCLAPVELIERVEGDFVVLNITTEEANALPEWEPLEF